MASTNQHHSSILIVGAGIFGTSTAYHLSLSHSNPSSITVLDRAPFPSPQAASSDINKIVRADYGNPFYMDLAYEAMDVWRTSEILKPYFHQTGWIMLDESSSDLAKRIRNNFKNSGRPDPSSDISLDEIRNNWDGLLKDIDTTDYASAYYNVEAGWADASLATEALMKEAVKNGIKYEVGEVTELVPSAAGLQGIKTSDGQIYTADKIVLATAAWTSWLMSPLEDSLNILDTDRIETQLTAAGCCVAAFKLSPDEAKQYGQLPVLIYGGKGEVMPPKQSQRLFKFTNASTFTNHETTPSGRSISVPPLHQSQHTIPPTLMYECNRLIDLRIPAVRNNDHRQPDFWRICWDAISPDQNQLITQHPDSRLKNLYFATAGSFHSWKFLPTIGKYVVNVLEGKTNGEERDKVWGWKRSDGSTTRGAHEKVVPRRDFKDFS